MHRVGIAADLVENLHLRPDRGYRPRAPVRHDRGTIIEPEFPPTEE
jgi:hypothetical protein